MSRASKLQAGHLRHFITIQRKSGATNTTGEETDTWTTLGSSWASVEPFIDSRRGGTEEMQGSQLIAISWMKIRMRYMLDISILPRDRVTWNGRIFDIVNVNNREERNAELELICKERQNASAQ
jgi:SPP1 family predicted phage head-tail adaptor